MPDLRKIFGEYVQTANNPKYKGDIETINSFFPELKGYSNKTLGEYVQTANNPKYKGDLDVINSYFPEVFNTDSKKKVDTPTESSGMGVSMDLKGSKQKTVTEQLAESFSVQGVKETKPKPQAPVVKEEELKVWERTKSTMSTLGKSFIDGIFATSAQSIGIVSKTIDDELAELIGSKTTSKPLKEYQTVKWASQVMAATDEAFNPNPEFKGEIQETIAKTTGDLLGLVVTALITKNPSSAIAQMGLKGVVKGLSTTATRKAMAGMLAKETVKMAISPTGLLGSAQTGVANYNEAKEKGATDDEANAMFWSTAVSGGIVNSLPVGALLNRADKATGGKWKDMVVGGLIGGTEEAVTEVIEQVVTNYEAQNIYDETRNLLEGTGESASMGGGMGFFLNALGVKIGSLKNKYKGNQEKTIEIEQAIDHIVNLVEKEGQGSAIKFNKEEQLRIDKLNDIINNPEGDINQKDIATQKIQEITGQKIIDAENEINNQSHLSEDAKIDVRVIDAEIERLKDSASKSADVEIKDQLEANIAELQTRKQAFIESQKELPTTEANTATTTEGTVEATPTSEIYDYKGKRYEVTDNEITELGTDNIKPLEFIDELKKEGVIVPQTQGAEMQGSGVAVEQPQVETKENPEITKLNEAREAEVAEVSKPTVELELLGKGKDIKEIKKSVIDMLLDKFDKKTAREIYNKHENVRRRFDALTILVNCK